MSEMLNLNDITAQIRRYVNHIKARKSDNMPQISPNGDEFVVPYYNDLHTNINPLDGNSKFSIQTLKNDSAAASSEYAAEAYGHLSSLENKHKVVIDFMHKNNRNYDVNA